MNLDQKRDAIFCGLALTTAMVIGGVSLGYDVQSSYFPRLLALFLAALAVLMGARTLKNPAPGKADTDMTKVRGQLLGFAKVFGGVLLYVALVKLVSYPIATVVFLLGTMVMLGETNPLRLGLVAIMMTAVLYFLFFYFLGVTPPETLWTNG